MKLSIVILIWNDEKVLPNCLESVYKETRDIDFEVIISDNGSTDGMVDFVRTNYPQAIIVENKANLGFARGNNAGIAVAKGEYILILNPDTIICDRAFDKWIAWADLHPEAGAFGCRVVNPDGSFQNCGRPFPTIWRHWIAAFYLRPLALLSSIFYSDTYSGWDGTTERIIDWQYGCCILFRGNILKKLGGFDPRFFYHLEEVDLCYRISKAGNYIVYFPHAEIVHLGGQSVGRFPIRFALETYRSGYRYFHKHYSMRGARKLRIIVLVNLLIRQFGYGLISLFKKSDALKSRLEKYRVVIKWNSQLNVDRFISTGEEPDIGYEPLAPAPKIGQIDSSPD
jgi:GT2 family glycosyltransferase